MAGVFAGLDFGTSNSAIGVFRDGAAALVPVEAGATLIKAPYVTYYNWYQSVLLDPEGNVFRINFML